MQFDLEGFLCCYLSMYRSFSLHSLLFSTSGCGLYWLLAAYSLRITWARDDRSAPKPEPETAGESDALRPPEAAARSDETDGRCDRRAANRPGHRRLASRLANVCVWLMRALSRSRKDPPGRSTCTAPTGSTPAPERREQGVLEGQNRSSTPCSLTIPYG